MKVLNERYELGEPLGAGGMGRVYRATDVRLERAVAVKILRGDRMDDETARARLRAEARVAGRLHHPGIASVFDYGEDQDSAERDPFIVMQLVEGTSLGSSLRETAALDVAEVENLVAGVADALAAAHAVEVVHRDVKPANIMLTPDRRPVLVDFGIAASPDREALTQTGSILGTAEYLSPEQAQGQAGTSASDVYSLGLVAYQCLTGESPFKRETAVATAFAQVNDDLPAPPADAPTHLRELLVAMTAKAPEVRPSAREVQQLILQGTAVTDRTQHLPAVAAPAALRSRRRMRDVVTSQSTPTRALSGVAVALAGFLLVALFGGVFGGDESITAPDVRGMTLEQATATLDDAGLKVRSEQVDDPSEPAGAVVSQDPGDGEVVGEGETVRLTVASGRVRVAASDYVGESVDDARRALEKLGFEVTTTTVASSRAAGTVTELDRSGRLEAGSTIELSVARGQSTSSGSGSAGAGTPAPKQEPKKAAAGPGQDKGKGKGKGPGKD